MSELWNKWQGYQVNGAFPLHRYLGGSDHSGVFLTELRGREPAEAAIKLIPSLAAVEQSHLARWEATAGLSHPHLLPILETGRCQLDGRLFQFAVMAYADQTLAQLLEHRAMTEDEAREMLPPVLSALAFLHNRNLVQGQLKPANVLVVGDQIKLASDTVRPVSDAAVVNMVSAHDPPELQDGVCSTAGDIWAFGITLFEALTRKPALGLQFRRDRVALPADFPAAFREIVTGCLSRRPYDRPKVTELEAKLRGQAPGAEGVSPKAGEHDASAPKRGSIEITQWEPHQSQGEVTSSAQPGVIEHVFREMPSPSTRVEPRLVAVEPAQAVAQAPPAGAQPPSPRAPPRVTATNASVLAASYPAASRPRASQPAVVQSAVVRTQSGADQVAVAANPAIPLAALSSETPALPSDEMLVERPAGLRSFRLPLAFGTVAIIILVWAGMRAYSAHQAPMPAVAPVPDESELHVSSAADSIIRETVPAERPRSVFATSKVRLSGGAKSLAARQRPAPEPTPPASDIHQEFPDVPPHVRRSIHGHVRVSVRVIVDKDGTVFAALVEQPGPSPYFERIAIEAAKKWTFPASNTQASRMELVLFDFAREGTTAHVDTVE